MTADESAVYFPAYMYESILRVATGDPEFEFKVKSITYPVNHLMRRYFATSDASTIIFFVSITYSIIITMVMSYLVVERSTQLKHVQLITGMRLTSYWLANFIFDGIKLYLAIITTIVLLHTYDYGYDSSEYVILLFPFGILPFTYVISFCFQADSTSQTFTMFCHLSIMLCFSMVILILRFMPLLEVTGDRLHNVFRLVPTYSVASAINTEAAIDYLSIYRTVSEGGGEEVSPDPWHWKNNLMDILL